MGNKTLLLGLIFSICSSAYANPIYLNCDGETSRQELAGSSVKKEKSKAFLIIHPESQRIETQGIVLLGVSFDKKMEKGLLPVEITADEYIFRHSFSNADIKYETAVRLNRKTGGLLTAQMITTPKGVWAIEGTYQCERIEGNKF